MPLPSLDMKKTKFHEFICSGYKGKGKSLMDMNIEPATPHKEIPGFLSLEKKGKLVSERKASKKKLEDVLSSHPISGSSKEDSASSDLDGVPTAWLERQKKARGRCASSIDPF